jgi:Zn-finger nucleic acid-binding protein
MTCPQCQGEMAERTLGHVTAYRCVACSGVFLVRTELGALIEAENDWHAHQSMNTAALPRITNSTPPPVTPTRSRSYVETLFNG